MYYHCREMKYTEYGKVLPPPISSYDGWEEFRKLYEWLGKHCGYCPQIWLSRSRSVLTGYKRKPCFDDDWVMFGFDTIKGFPIHFDRWEFLMCELMGRQDIGKHIDEFLEFYKEDGKDEPLDQEFEYLLEYRVLGEKRFLEKHLFIEHDQVVVPSLNLKVAKEIICRNEKQKKKLRKMGFIEDRIKIKNLKYPYSY